MITRPTIPNEEFQNRREIIQDLMRKYEIDLLFFFGDDKAVFGANHTRWLTNYAPHFEPICLALTMDSQIHGATGAESEVFYANTAKSGHVHVVDEFNMPEEEYPYTKTKSFKNFIQIVVGEKNSSINRVAAIGLEHFPYWLVKLIKSHYPNLTTSKELEEEYRLIRASKSKNEILVMDYAFEIAEVGFNAGLNALAEGVAEREVAAEIEYAMRKMGSEGNGIDMIVGFGKTNTFPILTRTTFNELKRGDLALLTIAPRYEGYHGVIARPIAFGKTDSEIRRAIDVSIEASAACESALKIGSVGADVAKAGLSVLSEHKLIEFCVYSGIHSMGTSEFEPPILTSYSDFIVPENAYFSIDVPLFFAPWGGLRVETGFFVDENGANRRFSEPARYLEI